MEPPTSLGIAFHDRVDILGVEFCHTIALSMQDSWSRVTRAVRAQAHMAYARNLCLVQRIQYVQQCFLQGYGMLRRSSHYLAYRRRNSRPYVLGSCGRGQPLGCLWRPFHELNTKVDEASRMLRLNARPSYKPDLDDGCTRQIRDVGSPVLLERPGGTHKPNAILIPSKFVCFRQYVIDMAYVAPLCSRRNT